MNNTSLWRIVLQHAWFLIEHNLTILLELIKLNDSDDFFSLLNFYLPSLRSHSIQNRIKEFQPPYHIHRILLMQTDVTVSLCSLNTAICVVKL